MLRFLSGHADMGEYVPPPPKDASVLAVPADDERLQTLVTALLAIGGMDKRTMSGACAPQTKRMENFMYEKLAMRNIRGEVFVSGVRAFRLETPINEYPDDHVFDFCDGNNSVQFSAAEVREWQSTYCVYAADDIYVGDEGKALLQKSLRGKSAAGDEAWKMKFVARMAKNPVVCKFDGKVLSRGVGDEIDSRIWLCSVSGVDFAGREHDIDDVRKYITNWRKVYYLHPGTDKLYVHKGRDFVETGVRAELDIVRLSEDLKKMARVRLRGQDDLGIQIVGETGIGLGVFSGDCVGVGAAVRALSAQAVKTVLEEDEFSNIKMVVFSMPIFKRGAPDNFHYFAKIFEDYKGSVPVMIMDQDMHAIARCAAELGWETSELNPADSHGVFGEYWQNYGPGTEEKLALTTLGLLTQHHAVNPRVLDTCAYRLISGLPGPAGGDAAGDGDDAAGDDAATSSGDAGEVEGASGACTDAKKGGE